MTTTAIDNALTLLEGRIYDNFMLVRPFILAGFVMNLKEYISDAYGTNVYVTESAIDDAVAERVEGQRERAILKCLSEAKKLLQNEKAEYAEKTDLAMEIARTQINDYTAHKDYSWVKDASLELDRAYKKKLGILTPSKPVEKPKKHDLKGNIDTICQLIYDDFMGYNSFQYLVPNAQMLRNYLSTYWKGGPALDNAFADIFESIRESAILYHLEQAKKFAIKRSDDYKGHLQLAFDAKNAQISGYTMPNKYEWFSSACEKINVTYNTAGRTRKKK